MPQGSRSFPAGQSVRAGKKVEVIGDVDVRIGAKRVGHVAQSASYSIGIVDDKGKSFTPEEAAAPSFRGEHEIDLEQGDLFLDQGDWQEYAEY